MDISDFGFGKAWSMESEGRGRRSEINDFELRIADCEFCILIL